MRRCAESQVLGFGQCSLDYLGRLDEYPGRDQKAELDTLLVQGGGPVATALVTLARLGVPVAMAGAVGDDDAGSRIRAGLLDEQVNCEYLQVDAGQASQVAFIAVDGKGHRTIFWHRGAASFSLSLDFSGLPNCRILHLDGLHLEPALRLARLARQQGITTVLDGGSLRPGTEQLLPLIDHLVVSEKFARQVAGDDPRQALELLVGYGAQAVTVTLGERGSMTRLNNGAGFAQPAFEVDAVDTTGCGDVFHGGYIFGLLQGWSVPRAVRYATACAALKCRALGGRTAIPRHPDVEDFLRSRADAGRSD